jgi:cytohesin
MTENAAFRTGFRMTPHQTAYEQRAMLKRFIHFFTFGIFLALALVTMSSTHAMCQQIHKAVKDNNLPEVRQLLKHDPSLVSSRDENGFTPLHLAAANGYKSMVEFLLTTKADVNAKDNAGSTPLHQAAAADGGHSDIVELLLAHKADVNAADTQGLTPLHYALLADNPDVATALLNHGANPNVKDNTAGHTPLILAAAKGYKQVTELLLMHGADVNAADDRGTPLAWAIRKDHANVADLLRRHGGHE